MTSPEHPSTGPDPDEDTSTEAPTGPESRRDSTEYEHPKRDPATAGHRTSDESDAPVILVVDDERQIADLFATWLSTDYDVRTAYGGHEALEQIDDSVDVALLDRRMPGLSGGELLSEIRSRGVECRVAMVTAVEPDLDIVDMAFDAYLTKPVPRDRLLSTVEGLLSRADYDERIQTYFALASKKAILDAERPEEQLAGSEAYARLEDEIAAIQQDVDDVVREFDDDAVHSLIAELPDGTASADR